MCIFAHKFWIMKLNNNYILREVAGEKLLVKQGTAGIDMTKIISMNASAVKLWENFYGKVFTAEQAAEFLVDVYGIDMQKAMHDAEDWINKLAVCGVIEK